MKLEWWLPAGRRTICAFCLMTSAGVRIRHDASSAIDEAAEWTIGRGINGCCDPLRVGLIFIQPLLTASYVVKKIPATNSQYRTIIIEMDSHEGKVTRITLPTPWYKPLNRTALLTAFVAGS